MVTDHEDRLDADAILTLCDRVIGEPGRRRHLFSWLRAPGSDADQWLAVDAYYPGSRVVVVCGEHPEEDEDLYDRLVPAHGLRLLRAEEVELGPDAMSAEAALRRVIAELELPPRPTGLTVGSSGNEREPAGPGTIARIASAFSQAGAAREAARRRQARVRRGGPRGRPNAAASARAMQVEAVGVAAGLVLAAVVCLELYFGVGTLALAGGHWLLAFGIAMDACSRALGAIATERAGQTAGTWWSVIVGSPAVVRYVLYGEDGPLAVEPAPLAALLAIVAIVAIGLAFLVAMLGL